MLQDRNTQLYHCICAVIINAMVGAVTGGACGILLTGGWLEISAFMGTCVGLVTSPIACFMIMRSRTLLTFVPAFVIACITLTVGAHSGSLALAASIVLVGYILGMLLGSQLVSITSSPDPDSCSRCGYKVESARISTCPECGQKLDATNRPVYPRTRVAVVWTRTGSLLCVALFAVLAFGVMFPYFKAASRPSDPVVALLDDLNQSDMQLQWIAKERLRQCDSVVWQAAITDSRARVRAAAAHTLGQVSGVDAASLLESALSDSDEHVRMFAIMSLDRVDHDRLLGHYDSLSRDKSAIVRLQLGSVKTPK